PFERKPGENPYDLHSELQETMQDLVGIFRVERDLTQALSEIQDFKARSMSLSISGSRMFNPGWHLCADLKSLLTVSEAVTRSAIARKESRGAHSRIDFAEYDETWGKQNNIISRGGQEMMLQQRPTPAMPQDLQALVQDEKGAGA
ncbi:MAG TPA: fumarate reductase/succinate dehydrogenase flavoprotein subunit, partial [Terriglobales bacterium]|nr:fumarate reductase/succinate dehydrogenase flavoprotein subunit [Terriglobales bacterium]